MAEALSSVAQQEIGALEMVLWKLYGEAFLRQLETDLVDAFGNNVLWSMWLDMLLDMCVDMCLDMCLGMWLDMCLDMCLAICLDTWLDMCLDLPYGMGSDMCLDMLPFEDSWIQPVLGRQHVQTRVQAHV